jgi:putative oxidoreductase
MKRIVDIVTRIYARLDRLEWLARLLARAVVGVMFFGSGLHSLRMLDEFVAYFRKLGVPAAAIQAPVVATVELVAGALLVVGLAARPAAAMLAGVMVVSITTAQIDEHHVTLSWSGLLDFLYIPDVLLLVLLIWLVTAGAGAASLDHRIASARRSGSTLT